MSKEARDYFKFTHTEFTHLEDERELFFSMLDMIAFAQAYADEQVKPYIDLFNWIVECGENLSTIDKQVQFKRKLKQLEK